MATSKQPRPAETFASQALALAWGAWTELGVSGWTATHQDWAIDPEPLIILTAWLGDNDPRLRDEATDWCIGNWRFVSKTRLKNLLRRHDEHVQKQFGEFAATVGSHAGIVWPGATAPRPYAATGRTTLPPLGRPSLAWLRTRAMFGLGARTEILRHFLSRPTEGDVSVARLADTTSYTKRNIADECEMLERAGVLAVRSMANRHAYSFARRRELEVFVGSLPRLRPDWPAMVRVTIELVGLEKQAPSTTPRTLAVHARQTLDRVDPELRELGITPLSADLHGEHLWPAVRQLGVESLGAWSIGSWPA